MSCLFFSNSNLGFLLFCFRCWFFFFVFYFFFFLFSFFFFFLFFFLFFLLLFFFFCISFLFVCCFFFFFFFSFFYLRSNALSFFPLGPSSSSAMAISVLWNFVSRGGLSFFFHF